MSPPLDGIEVLDFSTLLPGPMATLLLAEAGAAVTKIERPGRGDELRDFPPRFGAEGAAFTVLNRGKRSLAVDLKSAAGRATIAPLVERADVLVEQFRPGVMERLGLGYEAVCARNPRIVYCSITGYGQSGPKRGVAGHDLNYIGDTGLLSQSMGCAEQPVVPPALIADIAGGSYPAVMNILLALRARDGTGRGCHLDISMTDNLFPLMYSALAAVHAAGTWPRAGGELLTGGSPRYQLYPAADRRLVAVAALEDRFWARFTEAIGLELPYRDDRKDPARTGARIAEIVAERPSEVWRSVLAEADCCCSIVNTLEEALAEPHFGARELFDAGVSNPAGAILPAMPVPIVAGLRVAPGAVRPAPALGEHDEPEPAADPAPSEVDRDEGP